MCVREYIFQTKVHSIVVTFYLLLFCKQNVSTKKKQHNCTEMVFRELGISLSLLKGVNENEIVGSFKNN